MRKQVQGNAITSKLNPICNAVALLLGTSLVTGGAAAQESEVPSTGIEIISVKATKRTESLQDVAVSVAAVKGDTIEKLSANGVENLTQFVPNLSFQDGGEAKSKGFNIRGIGTATFNDGVEESVGVAIDGVTLGRSGMGLYDLYDVSTVEVLRGPQGTLFGKGASAGVISINTNDPNLNYFESQVRAAYGQYDANDAGEVQLNAAVSGPLSDSWAFRLAAYKVERDGLARDYFRNIDTHDKDQQSMRAKLLYQPNDNFSAKFTFDFTDSDNDCCAEIVFATRENNTAGAAADTYVGDYLDIGWDNRDVAQNAPTTDKNTVRGYTVDLNYSNDDIEVTAISAFRTWDSFKTTDTDKTSRDYFDVTSTGTSSEQFSQEIRVASPQGEQLEYVTGIYFFEQSINSLEIFGASLGADTIQNYSENPIRIDSRSVAVFGSATYHFTEQFDVTAGLRYTNEDLDGTVVHQELGPVELFANANASETTTDNKVTGRVALRYYPSEEVMLFASYGTGYKSPAFNANSIQPAGLTTQIVPGEESQMYEAGIKSRWFDGNLQTNITFFYSTFEGFQASAAVPIEGSEVPSNRLASVDEIKTQGLEADITYQVTEDLISGVSFSLTDSEFGDFDTSPCYRWQTAELGCVNSSQNLTGKALPYQGDLQYSAYLDYETEISGDKALFASMNYAWMDERNTDWTLDPMAQVDSYGLLSARLGIRLAERWEFSIVGNNLTNEDYVTKVRSSGLCGCYSGWKGTPRYVGISATYTY